MTNGKGDKQRPRLVSRDEWERNWDAVFGKSKCEPARGAGGKGGHTPPPGGRKDPGGRHH